MAGDFLDEIFNLCNISAENKDYVINKLFKYKNNPVVQTVCSIINDNAKAHINFLDFWNQAGKVPHMEYLTWPLIIPSPNNPITLRVYPNIILNSHRGIENISPSTCTSILKTLLEEYEADIADKSKKQKWEPVDRAVKYLNTYIDMPTARALSRYVFTDGRYKDSVIRDFADAIDSIRKPLELIYAEKPEDFVKMYATGPSSCMGVGAGDRQTWKFLEKDHGICPTSWYAYCPFTKGVYAEKAGKVIARVILYHNKAKDTWQYGRIYPINAEVNTQFIETLKQNNILPLPNGVYTVEPGFEFKIPGVNKNNTNYAAPWPYFDNFPRNFSSEPWHISYDKNTHEFTVQYAPSKLLPRIQRSGHILSSDYETLQCSACDKIINRNSNLKEVEGGEYVFCSHDCAGSMGFNYVVDGTGNGTYKKETDDMVSTLNDSFMKFSTLKAAIDCGYAPIIEEHGVIPEENDYRVYSRVDHWVREASSGLKMGIIDPFGIKNTHTPSKLPYRIEIRKEVIYDENNLVVEV